MNRKLSIKRKNKKQAKVPPRITNETVAEHREQIIAGGRKFKYPIQYARHRFSIQCDYYCNRGCVPVPCCGLGADVSNAKFKRRCIPYLARYSIASRIN